jgi:predicted dehydrogenase
MLNRPVLNRRNALKSTALAAAATTFVAKQATAARKASDRIPMGIIGCGGQGMNLLRLFAAIPEFEITYVCDPDSQRSAGAVAEVEKLRKTKPQAVSDFRKVLDDGQVAAVAIATPDHWHAPAAIMACDAGKHVYVEKPCAHNIREGRLLVEAAARSKRKVQHGTQSRSLPLVAHAIEALHQGVIGRVVAARAFNIQQRRDIGRAQSETAPATIDYDQWVGPAEMVPYQPNRLHYNWHWWHNFGTGDTGNDGVHELDIARWGLGVETHPKFVSSVGGKYVFNDDQEFPDTQVATFDYPGSGEFTDHKQLTFEMRIWSPVTPDEGIENGVAFYGTEGWMLLAKRGLVKVFGRGNKPKELPGKQPSMTSHHQNFADAILKDEPLRAPIEIAHLSASLVHFANISTRLRRALEIEPQTERFVADNDANQLVSRPYRKGHWAIPQGV